MEDDKNADANTKKEIENKNEDGQGSQPDISGSSELSLPAGQSSRRPFTSLSQEDSDLVLARALQEQERAYMLLRMNADSSDHETSGSGSYDHEDYVNDSGENEDEVDVNPEEFEADTLVNGETGELDASLFESDEAYARALQEAEDREMTARMMALAGINEWEEDDNEDDDGSSQDDTWQDVDPDNMLYEELVALGEVVGIQSKGLDVDSISSLPLSKYVSQSPSSSNSEQCVICRLEYEEGDMILTLPCKHQYHSDCIKDWLKINKICPVCSVEVSNEKSSLT
uniref:TSA: Wollemia nobilis Ref_Wollemi_Transcript_30427_1357 transcribed RNA sequence n=1 Tax=Wollemia nobilis TaxID=56998 RepID=A0A0C9S3B2_9CONI